jgi:hypothetical protein
MPCCWRDDLKSPSEEEAAPYPISFYIPVLNLGSSRADLADRLETATGTVFWRHHDVHHADRFGLYGIPPMGARFRLKGDYDISRFPPEMQVILRAMKEYGMMLADNGSSWYVSGAPDERWDNDMLHQLDVLKGDDFKAVDPSALMVDQNSGEVK